MGVFPGTSPWNCMSAGHHWGASQEHRGCYSAAPHTCPQVFPGSLLSPAAPSPGSVQVIPGIHCNQSTPGVPEVQVYMWKYSVNGKHSPWEVAQKLLKAEHGGNLTPNPPFCFCRECLSSVLCRWPLWPWGATCSQNGARGSAGSWPCPLWCWSLATWHTCS